jgi:hypothetical protein
LQKQWPINGDHYEYIQEGRVKTTFNFIKRAEREPTQKDGQIVLAIDDDGHYVEIITRYHAYNDDGDYVYSFAAWGGRPVHVEAWAKLPGKNQ